MLRETKNLSTRFAGLAPDLVQSLAKGLAVIEAFGAATPRMTLSEVARRVGLSPGSAQRILRTLEELGYVGAEDGRFSLRPRALQLGYAYLASLPVAAIVQPVLTALTEATGETSSLSVLDGADVVYVARATAKRLARDYMSVGTRMPAHATSPGKVLLAALPEAARRALADGPPLQALTPRTITGRKALLAAILRVRKQGHATNDQETIMGLRALAVPVMVGGRAVAALGISAEVARIAMSEMEARFLPPLREAAGAVAAAMQAREPRGAPLPRYDGSSGRPT